MKKVKTVSQETCRDLRKSLGTTLGFLKNKNLSIDIGNMSYSQKQVTVKITFNLIEDGKIYDKDADNFRLYAAGHGLKKTWLHDIFQHKNESYKIVGLSIRSRKYPVIVEHVGTGKGYKFPTSIILRYYREKEEK